MGHGGARKGAGAKKKKLADVANVSVTPKIEDVLAAVPSDAFEAMMRSLPPDVTAHELLNAVIKSPVTPAPIRMHAAAKVLPYEVAKPLNNVEQAAGGIVFTLKRHGAA